MKNASNGNIHYERKTEIPLTIGNVLNNLHFHAIRLPLEDLIKTETSIKVK